MHVLVLVGVVSKNACMLCAMYKNSVIMVRIVSVVVVQVKLLKDCFCCRCPGEAVEGCVGGVEEGSGQEASGDVRGRGL